MLICACKACSWLFEPHLWVQDVFWCLVLVVFKIPCRLKKVSKSVVLFVVRGTEEVHVEIPCCWCLGVAFQACEVWSCLPRWNRLAGCERIADRCAFVLTDSEL